MTKENVSPVFGLKQIDEKVYIFEEIKHNYLVKLKKIVRL